MRILFLVLIILVAKDCDALAVRSELEYMPLVFEHKKRDLKEINYLYLSESSLIGDLMDSVHYFDRDDVDASRLFFLNGLASDFTQKKINCHLRRYVITQDREVLFETDEINKLYGDEMNHSSFTFMKPIICAGRMAFKDGQLIHIDNHSGHYKPKMHNLLNAIEILKENGVKLNGISAAFYETKNNSNCLNSEALEREDLTVQIIRGKVVVMPLYMHEKRVFERAA